MEQNNSQDPLFPYITMSSQRQPEGSQSEEDPFDGPAEYQTTDMVVSDRVSNESAYPYEETSPYAPPQESTLALYPHNDYPPDYEDDIPHAYKDNDAEYVGDLSTYPDNKSNKRNYAWGLFQGFRDDPYVFGFDDDDDRRFGEWDEPDYDQPPRPVEDPEEKKRKRELCCWILLCLCCCCLILVLLLGGIGAIIYGLNKEDDAPPYIPEIADDDWEMTRPYLGIRTTTMDEYPADCVYDDEAFPHVLTQCDCAGKITKIPSDTLALYHQVREDITEEIYYGDFKVPIDSCEPANKALLWLSSGDTRDGGDLYQRYVLANKFFNLNGTSWDLSNLWLSNNNECLWMGIQCNTNYRIISLDMDTNNVQ